MKKRKFLKGDNSSKLEKLQEIETQCEKIQKLINSFRENNPKDAEKCQLFLDKIFEKINEKKIFIEKKQLDNFYNINQDGKYEICFDRNFYKSLSNEQKKEIKSFALWSNPRKCWISKAFYPNDRVNFFIKQLNIPLNEKQKLKSIAEREEGKVQKAQARIEKIEKKIATSQERQEQLEKQFEKYKGDISFWTQPNINSSKGKGFTNARNKVISKAEKSYEEQEYQKKMQEKLSSISASDNPNFYNLTYLQKKIDERIKIVETNQKYIDDVKERMKNPALTEESRNKLNSYFETYMERIDRYLDELEFYQTKKSELIATGVKIYNKANLIGVKLIKRKKNNSWYAVIKLNPTTVTHTWFAGSWKTLYSDISDVIFESDENKYLFKAGRTGNVTVIDKQTGKEI